MYSVNSSNLTGTTLFDHWPLYQVQYYLPIGQIPDLYNIVCSLGKYQIQHSLPIGQLPDTTLFAQTNARYNIVCPLGKYQVQQYVSASVFTFF